MQTARGRRGLLLNHARATSTWHACRNPGVENYYHELIFTKQLTPFWEKLGKLVKMRNLLQFSTPTPMYGEKLCIFKKKSLLN